MAKKQGCPKGTVRKDGECLIPCKIYAIRESALGGENLNKILVNEAGFEYEDISYIGKKMLHKDDF